MRLRSIATAGAAVLAVAAAQAEPAADGTPRLACADRAAMVKTLEARYGETLVATGVENSGHVIELFASARSGSWTILATDAAGTACVMSVGRHFEPRAPRRPEATARRAAPASRG